MMKLIFTAALVAGLAVLGWVGVGYIGGHTLALALTLLIAAFYLAGAWELWLFRRGSSALERALKSLKAAPANFDGWLASLPAGLSIPVRQRVEGGRSGLPGPVLVSYITGLLVLLGMLGTFLGMVVTLRGTGSALLGAEGLQAIRDALAAPVRGLGLAFGTSVAGVGASAALGLMTSLARRERLQVAQQLDAAMATVLRPFTAQHQREVSLHLMEQQVSMMPSLVEKIGSLVATLELQQAALNERLTAEQARFHETTETAYASLAASVERSLTTSAIESARHAGEAIQPAVQAALQGLASESARLQAAQAEQMRAQLNGMASQFGEATDSVTKQWTAALTTHQQTSEAATQALRGMLDEFAGTFQTRTSELSEVLMQRLESQAQAYSARWSEALALQAQSNEQWTSHHHQALEAAALTARQKQEELQKHMVEQTQLQQAEWKESLRSLATALQQEWRLAGTHSAEQWQGLAVTLSRTAESITGQLDKQVQSTLDEIRTLMQATADIPGTAAKAISDLTTAQEETQRRLAKDDEARQSAWTESLRAVASSLQAQWQEAGTRSAQQWQDLGDMLSRTAAGITQELELRTQSTLAEIGTLVQAASEAPRAAAQVIGELKQAHDELHNRLALQDEARQTAWTDSLRTVASTLQEEWQQAGARSAQQWQGWSEELSRTAEGITSQLETQARSTLSEISTLMQSASAAPQAAAEVIGELRQKLSDSMVHDNAMLEERTRILQTLSTLLDSVNQAAAEQRSAIDALVSTTSGLMERASGRFAETLDAQTGRIDAVAAQLTGSAVEVASLGEAFGAGVQHFGEANQQLVEQLQRVESALTKSLARSDEQLDYYVAQAREVVELSTGAQTQIIDELRQLAAERAAASADAVAS